MRERYPISTYQPFSIPSHIHQALSPVLFLWNQAMSTITPPDGHQRQLEPLVTMAQVATNIGVGLAKATVVAKMGSDAMWVMKW